MAIKIVHENHHRNGKPDMAAPKVTCDACEEVIEDAGRGMYVWFVGDEDREAYYAGQPWDVYTVHKGRCWHALARMEGFEDEAGREKFGIMDIPLTCLPVYLAGNLGIRGAGGWRVSRELVANMGGAA